MGASETVAKRIAALRKERGYTQDRLGAESGFSGTYIGFIEQGKKKPTIPTLEKIAKGLRVSLEDLFRDV